MAELKVGQEYIMVTAVRKDELDDEDIQFIKEIDGVATMEELVRIKSVENKTTTYGKRYQRFGFTIVNGNDFGYSSYYPDNNSPDKYGVINMVEVR